MTLPNYVSIIIRVPNETTLGLCFNNDLMPENGNYNRIVMKTITIFVMKKPHLPWPTLCFSPCDLLESPSLSRSHKVSFFRFASCVKQMQLGQLCGVPSNATSHMDSFRFGKCSLHVSTAQSSGCSRIPLFSPSHIYPKAQF